MCEIQSIILTFSAQRLYPTTPTMSESESVTDEDMSVSMTETDDTLAKSISLGLDEDLSAPETSGSTCFLGLYITLQLHCELSICPPEL